jgi:predicted DNA-binding protein
LNHNLEKTIGVRVTEELYELLTKVCNNRGEDVAGFIRRAVLRELAELGYLSAEQKKALGVSTNTKKDEERRKRLREDKL